MFQGEGANGKSVLLDTLTAVVGAENASHSSLGALGQDFGLAPLLGKLVNIAAEIEVRTFDEELLKKLVGGDPVTVNRKRRDQQTARLKARLLFASNSLPRFNDRSSGMLRRAIIIPCNVTIPPKKQDLDLADKLRAELPGIFNWAMRGLDRLRGQGTFTEPPACKTALEAHREQSNPTRTFIVEQYEANSESRECTATVYWRYKEWCEPQGYKPLDAGDFGKEVKRAFPSVKVGKMPLNTLGKRPNAYVGIRWRQESPEVVPVNIPQSSVSGAGDKRGEREGVSATGAVAPLALEACCQGSGLSASCQAKLADNLGALHQAERSGQAPVVDV